MTTTLRPGARTGTVTIPASKSQAHRLLLCAALSDAPSEVVFRGLSEDIRATMQCLEALGAEFAQTEDGVCVTPLRRPAPSPVALDVGESGSTLRFLLPILGALGVQAELRLHGRLPQRPLGALAQQLTAHGMTLRQNGDRLYTGDQLCAGAYSLPGNVSSQFFSGLLFALPLLPQSSTLCITSTLQSASYVSMTEQALRTARLHLSFDGTCWTIPGAQRYAVPAKQQVEGDWSNAAFFLCMGALSDEGVSVRGLRADSLQSDRAVVDILRRFGAQVEEANDKITVRRGALRGITLDAGPIPDLIPVLAVLAAFAEGQTHITNAARLRLKESDRLQTTAALLRALGGTVDELPDGLVIYGSRTLLGGSVHSCGDHRIAMSAAVAACGCREAVFVNDSSCVAKSYPDFWTDLAALQEEAV